ncbi:MAG: BamA/TamA family outer membrane protein [Myxococcaceae bacterium]
MPHRLLALLVLLAPLAVAAEVPDFEQRLIELALSRTARTPEPFPEGRTVEEILVESEEIFAAADPYPDLLNVFHRLTREDVVRREVLLPVGAPYRAELAAETERNLRDHFIFAVAKVVPVAGRAGGVALLVVTKDRWTLRLNSDFSFVGRTLLFLRLQPAEQNFLGNDQQVALDFVLRPDTLQLGQAFEDKRLFAGRVALGESAALVVNRQSRAVEGSAGKVVLTRKLLSLDDTWGFSMSAGWSASTSRSYGPDGQTLYAVNGGKLRQRSDLQESDTDAVPYVYEGEDFAASALYTRSFGRALKANVSAGAGAYARKYRAPPAALLSDGQRAILEGKLPLSESAVYLTARLRLYEARFRALHDIDSFTLSEDTQLGGQAQLWARWANPAFFSPSAFVESGGWARYRLLAADDLASVVVAASVRAQGGWVNRHLAAEVSNVSPHLGFGRIVARALVHLREADQDLQPALLGGANGLRGTGAGELSGQNMALVNVELRTRPVEFQTVYVGLDLFWDAGAAFDHSPVLTHTLGVGLRILLPQFNKETIRIDFGMVLNGAGPNPVGRFSASYGQVTDYRPTILEGPRD